MTTPTKNEIHYVSTFEMYKKEESGLKPNTIRCISHLFVEKKLPVEKIKQLQDKTHITIHKGYTKEKFTRRITDITIWDNWVIYSWNPNETKKGK